MATKLKNPRARCTTTGLRRRRYLVPAFPDLTWIFVAVHAFLLAILSIFLSCWLRHGGSSAVFWLEPHTFGYSAYTIATGVNLLLLITLIGGIFITPFRHEGTTDRVRVGTFCFALALLTCTQALMGAWCSAAEADLQRANRWRAPLEARLAAIKQELATLGEHPWAGEFVKDSPRPLAPAHPLDRYWLAPESGGLFIQRDEWLTGSGEPLGPFTDAWLLSVESNGASVLIRFDERIAVGTYLSVTWGERRYLVEGLEPSEVPNLKFGGPGGTEPQFPWSSRVLLRASDLEKPIFGAAKVAGSGD